MKKYNEIGDLYREAFADYAPEPPASVWEGVKSATQNKSPMWKKWTLPFAGTVLVGAVIYLFMVNPNPQESVILTVNDQQENTENQIVDKEVSSVENLSDDRLIEKNTPVLQQVNSPIQNIAVFVDFPTNDNSAEEISKVVVEQSVSDKKTSPIVATNASDAQNQNQEQNSVKPVRNDNPLPKVLPVRISRDTTVCERTAVQLYALNAENIHWSTGETKNSITVYPSYSEQYSVTFSTANAKDTTVYIHINVVTCAEVYIPNAFTPNGDEKNDIFLAKTEMELKFFEMVIYSANGQELFRSNDINRGWDGRYRNQPQPHGVYRYKIRYTDSLGKTVEKPGELLLILQ
jgi:gliding motility-associated-like protein